VVPVSQAQWLWLFRAGGAGRRVEWVGKEEGPGHASLPASCCGYYRACGAGLTAAPASLALGAAGTGAAAARGPGWAAVARARTVAGHAIPGIVVFFFWLVVVILAIIMLAFIVYWPGGGVLKLRLGHFALNVGFT